MLDILTTIFGIAMSVAALPQAYKTFKNKSSKNVSIYTFVIYFIGSIIWFIYGLSTNSFPIIISYSIGSLSSFLVVFGWLIYK